MSTIYLCIVIFLLCLAVFDLFVGVSNDAVNFLQSAVGAKVAKFRTILIITSFGVVLGAVMSNGMMDVARHGILMPANYSFEQVITIFLAVMVTDVIVLDIFNSLGMPTSTTVSLVFELLGGTFIMAVIKMAADDTMGLSDLMNAEQGLKVITAIFCSVGVAFIFGLIVMWISRVVFTFNYKKHSRFSVAIFGGIACTVLAYFIFLKGLGKSPYLPEHITTYIKENTLVLMAYTFVVTTILMQILYHLKVNIFKLVVLIGTFALAMSFAGNDLVNFIGVPLAGLSSYQDFMANANGAGPTEFMMVSLMESAKTPPFYLGAAGLIMITAMATSKKAHNVIKTSVDLSRQDEGEEMFGSSKAARAIVHFAQNAGNVVANVMPERVLRWLSARFNKREVELDNGAAFDVVRAAVNLVIASMLITFGTNYGLPLSTTYVTFMVAMGSSLADKAWSRESAVFRVTGMLSVIGGWFITAGVAFGICGIICTMMYYGGIIVQTMFIALVIIMLIRSNRAYAKKLAAKSKEDSFHLMMRTRDPELVWEMLTRHVTRTQSYVCDFALGQFNKIVDAFQQENIKKLRQCNKDLRKELVELKKYRRQEMLGLKKSPSDIAIERNTWFHLGANSSQQLIYCLRRMLDPIKEHVDNNFNPVPKEYMEEFEDVQRKVNELMKLTTNLISTRRYDNYRDVLADADNLKDELSIIRKRHIDRMQESPDNINFQVSVVYLNLLQESQEFLSAMRHQLRASKRFTEQ
ncbi:MAG: inorganic phosphate transporter [Prevotella sp.]|jgi:phosphate/sulfate permease